MDLNAVEEDLFAATDALWPDDGALDEATQFAMHDRLVQYIAERYADACVRDALVFSTDGFFADPELQRRDGGPLTAAERRGLGRKWKRFIKQATRAAGDVHDALARAVGDVVASASGVITQAVCGQLAAAAAAATGLETATAPAAPYVGSAVYFWCLDRGEREVKKAVATENVRRWKSGGGRPLGHHEHDMIEAPPLS